MNLNTGHSVQARRIAAWLGALCVGPSGIVWAVRDEAQR